jgi:phage terminase large subunit-like protein
MFYGPADSRVWTWFTPEARRLRRAYTEQSPLAFMLVYMTDSLVPIQTPYGPVISFSEFHLAMCEEAKHWMFPRERRTGIIAPRGAGKSTLLYVVLPLWALAHGHRKFFFGYADTNDQALDQLNKLRDELKTNDRLLYDYPELWSYRGGRNNKRTIETRPDFDGMLELGFKRREAMEICHGGGRIFRTAGVDKATLGASEKVGRPDLIVIDDGEPTATGYARRGGKDNKDMRLDTIRDVILRMSTIAAVLLSGTVVMPGAIADDLVKAALGEPTEPWVDEENFNVGYFDAIQDEDTPYERSLWQEKWSLEWLKNHRKNNPAKYATHYANRPMARGGLYWQEEHFQYGPHFPQEHFIMYVDPAESHKEASDYTGVVVLGVNASRDFAAVRMAWQGHINDIDLAKRIARYKENHPEIPLLDVYVEGFHSGELRQRTYQQYMPHGVRVHLDKPRPMAGDRGETGKVARIASAFAHYERRRVWHVAPFSDLEALLTSFPHIRRDDLPDALAGALRKANLRVPN